MTIIRSFCVILLGICLFSTSRAQHPLDRFLGPAPIKTEIGNADHGVNNPVDLDFCRVPGRKNELWVLNREFGSSSMSIFFHAGTPGQKWQYRKDSHSDHFMVYSSAMAMAANGNFGTTQEVQNSVGGGQSTFMGPVLWMSDTSVFARMYQSNWDPALPLGSHIDMLHQSPYSMGIASEKDNIYWVFDGYFGNLVKYDFAKPHTIGGDDHSDGRIWRYSEVKLDRIPDLPAHMILDSASGWLYIVDNSNTRIIRVNTKTGVKARDLQQQNEPLALYWEMKNVVQEVYIDTGLNAPVGIDIWNGRLVVTDNSNGQIRLYDATGAKGVYLGSIHTGAEAIMGVKVGPDSNLWYVDANANTVTRLTPAPAGKITQLSPANDEQNVPLTDTLKWRIDEGTFDNIRVRLRQEATNIFDTTLSATADQLVITDLLPGKRYAWRVIGMKDNAISASTPEWYFTAEVKTPAVPTLIAPADQAVLSAPDVMFEWAASENATHYQLKVSKNDDFSTIELEVDSTPSLTHLATTLEKNTKYYWHVRAYNELTNSDWSPTWSFTTSTLSVRERADAFAVSIYPNPMRSATTVTYTLPEHETLTFRLINAQGLTMLEGASQSGSFTLDGSTLAAGSYTLQLQAGEHSVIRSLVITE